MNQISVFDVIEILNVIPEILIIALFHQRILQNNYSSWLPYVIGYSISFVVLTAITIFCGEPQIQIIATLIILLASSIPLYSGSIVVKIFRSVYYIAVVLISETLFVGILMLMGYGNPTELLDSGVGRVIGMIGTKIFDFWIIVYSCRIYKSRVKSLPLRYWILILLMPFLSSIMLDLIFPKIGTDTSVMIFFIITIIGVMYLNLFVFDYFESYDKQVRLATLEKILEREDENYRTIESSYAEIRSFKHDLKNQIELLNDMIKRQDYEAAQKYMSRLHISVEQATAVCYTGNSAVDSIINIKGSYARSKTVSFMTKIKVSNIEFDSVKLCRILGNALDNAIEACERMDIDEKSICLVMNQNMNKLIIEINNTSPEVDTNNLSTSKKDIAIHGIGLKSIKQTVSEMNGTMSYSYRDGFFSLKIMLVK